jgi:hypothetical protein
MELTTADDNGRRMLPFADVTVLFLNLRTTQRMLTNADEMLTNADEMLTNADVTQCCS